jgi:hypothetical protein
VLLRVVLKKSWLELQVSGEDKVSISFSTQYFSRNDLSHQNTDDNDFLPFEDDSHEFQNNNDSQKMVTDYLLNPNKKFPNNFPTSLKKLYHTLSTILQYHYRVTLNIYLVREDIFIIGEGVPYLVLIFKWHYC